MEAANVHSLDERRAAATAGEPEPPVSEFDPVDLDDLEGADDPAPEPEADPIPPDDVPTADDGAQGDEDADEATAPDDEPVVPETPAEDTGPCPTCSGRGTHEMGGGEFETCDACGGTGREGAQGTLGIDGAGDTHAETGQARMFAADVYDDVTTGSRLGGRRATTGEVTIAGGKAKALKLDPRNRIPKGATIRLEVVGKVRKVGERDEEKDGFHAGTVREVHVKASHVQVVSWMHDEDGLRWDEDHGLRERIRDGVWAKVDDARADEVLPEPEADGGPDTGPGFGTATDEQPEGVPSTDDDAATGDEVPTELPATEPEPPVEDDAPTTEPEPAPAKVNAAAVILGRPETYTPEALEALKKDELREVLEDLNVSGVPARIDKPTLLAMALTATGNAPA